jgi:hypothetical protein
MPRQIHSWDRARPRAGEPSGAVPEDRLYSTINLDRIRLHHRRGMSRPTLESIHTKIVAEQAFGHSKRRSHDEQAGAFAA